MKLICLVDNKWGIGKDGGLLFNLPSDMKFFREKTLGKTVIMGRKTLESLPGGKPLKGRRNIVLTSGQIPEDGNLICVGSVEELFRTVDINSEDVFVIGGAKVYNALLDYCDKLYITKVDADGGADVFIKNIDEHKGFYLDFTGAVINENGLNFTFNTYKRR
ncbi:MAG: dihydrofolate reductase [Christensenellales bacterium]|jgi:dihydrofolate reductase